MLTAKDIEDEIQYRYNACKFKLSLLKDEVRIKQIKNEEIVLIGLINWIKGAKAKKMTEKIAESSSFECVPP